MQAEPSRRPDYTLPTASLESADPVLHQLAVVMGWWLPCLPGASNRKYRENAVDAVHSFRNGWGTFLPSERERAVDFLVSVWCKWQVDPTQVDPNMVVSYKNLSQEVKRTIPTIKKSQAETARRRMVAVGQDVVRSHPWDAIEQWYTDVFGSGVQGLTVTKLLRVPQQGWIVIQETLEHGRHLPSLDLLFDAAQKATQTALERSEIFHRCVDDLLTLCEAARRSEHVSREGHEAYLARVRSVFLSADEVRCFEEQLSYPQQTSAVALARSWLFSACQGHELKHPVPDLADMAHDLYRATGHDEDAVRRALAPPEGYFLRPREPLASTYKWAVPRTHDNMHPDGRSLRSLSVRARHNERSPYRPERRPAFC
ncbi:hypothetical protein JCM3775_007290 [Rhodotorula graminis]